MTDVICVDEFIARPAVCRRHRRTADNDNNNTTTTTTTTTNVMDYSAALAQLRGHFTKSRSKTVAQLNADVC